jgi:hypothetical protein
MVKAAECTRGQKVAYLAKKREKRKEEVVLEMVEVTRPTYFEGGGRQYRAAMKTKTPNSGEKCQVSIVGSRTRLDDELCGIHCLP